MFLSWVISRGIRSTFSEMLLRAISVVPPPIPDDWRSRKLKPFSAHGSSGSDRRRVGPGELERDRALALERHRRDQPGDGGAVVGHLAGPHAVGDAGRQRCRGPTRACGPRRRARCAPGSSVRPVPRTRSTYGSRLSINPGVQRAGDERRPTAHRVLLVEHPAGADGPALVDLADAVGVGDAHVGHELLAELLRAVDHLDAVQLDARLVDLDDEHAEAAVLGHVPVGAEQAQAVVGEPRAGRPDLRAVDDPLVAVAHRGGERGGDVGTTARLGEELHPDLLAL